MAELKPGSELPPAASSSRPRRPARHRRLAHGRAAGGRPHAVRQLPALLALLPRLGGRARRRDLRRLRPRLLQGLRDLRRGLPGRRDRDGAGMSDVRLLTGGEAVAHAMRQIDPDVVPVYPITPQTPIIQTFAKFVADGGPDTEIVNVESEHSAMSAAIGAALAGARTMTATSSQGLALMAEVVYIAASMRAPIVMALGNRALSGPINIHCDHSDSMLIRDSGVVQLFAENAQEAYDLTLLAPRLAEHPTCCCRCSSARTASRSRTRPSRSSCSPTRPSSASSASTASRTGARRATADDAGAVRDAGLLLRAAPPAGGRDRGGRAGLRGARRRARARHRPSLRRASSRTASTARSVIVALGSTAGTVKDVVDELREAGEPRRPAEADRPFRPFPAAVVAEALAGVAFVAVLDRADSPGGAPPLRAEVAAALYGSGCALSRRRLRARRPRPPPGRRPGRLRRRRAGPTSD